MAHKAIVIRAPQFVAVLPDAKFVLMARIGKPEPVACLRSVWALLGLSWDRWALLVHSKCQQGGVELWAGKDNRQRRTELTAWHKVPAVLDLLWQDIRAHAKAAVVNQTAKVIREWPDKRRLDGSMQLLTREPEAGHTLAAPDPENASQALKSDAPVLQPKPGRVKILRTVHLPEVLRLTDEGLNTVQIAKAMGISRPAVSQMLNDTYQYRHD